MVRGNVSHTTLNVLGKKVHLILCDGATLTLSGGILMYGDHRLYIHSQSYGGSMGKLVVQSGYNSDAAGIGSDYDGNSTSYQRTPADLEIHGGDIYVKGGDRAAGIGGGNYQHGGLVIIYGGKIAAHGGDGSGLAGNGGAGIVKWPTAGDPIENPVFMNVTIDNEFPIDQSVASRDGLVRFRGIYNPVSVTTRDRSMLYLDSGSTLRHPDSGTPINAFRAYFQFGEIPCDVNGDGIVDIADVTALIRFVLSGDASSIVIENADVNGDGEFTISDVTILIGFVLKDDCTIHVINVEVTGADSITFGGIGNGPAR